jgi:hypothetical protein
MLKWKLGEYIDAGNFGSVYRAMEVDSGRIIAVKKIPIHGLNDKELLKSLEVSSHHPL